MRKDRYILLFFLLTIFHSFFLRAEDSYYKIGVISSFDFNDTPAFWQTANQNGIIPDKTAAISQAEFYKRFGKLNDGWSFYAGADLVGSVSETKNRFFPSQFFVDISYNTMLLTFGIKHEETYFNGLSVSNKEFQWSNNARSLPGYTCTLTKYLPLWSIAGFFGANNLEETDFVKQLKYVLENISVNCGYGDYFPEDERHVDNSFMHKDKYSLRMTLVPKVAFTCSLDRIVYWGGTSDKYGRQPSSFSDYLRVITGRKGGNTASSGEQENKLGNSLGAYNFDLKFDIAGGRYLDIYLSHPFEDRSGMNWQNAKDEIRGICYYRGENKLIRRILYEAVYTKNQSGPYHNIGDVMLRGNDNYFNNYIYKSGHVYYNRTVGCPLLYPVPVGEDAVSNGVINNKVEAFHLGLDGVVNGYDYKFMATYANNSGTNNPVANNDPYDKDCNDYHLKAEVNIGKAFLFMDRLFHSRIVSDKKFNFIVGSTFSHYEEPFFDNNSLGAYFKISYSGGL